MTDHIRTNLRLWQKQSKSYDRRFARVLSGPKAMAWGFWRTPETSLRLLEEVRGRDFLEVGCGGARWSIALARAGARCVGLDFSSAQLAHARRESQAHPTRLSLVRASVESIPFRSAKFDRVFCDFGALTFADPRRAIPECSRVLRVGGLLVFATGSPIDAIARDTRHGRVQRRLIRPYFGLSRIEFPNEVNFQLPYGGWIQLFRQHHLTVERLVESQPTGRQRSAYLSRSESAWAVRWPLECIWKLRKIRPQRRR
ncbi:MAG: methyltransferase domain-containing protein [Thermoplasmata archaeon]|nr:methyltransferase domain-containing protein [Thermoplasmata archaeon]